ncbi:MAG: phosphotransferase [candidate division KSB1 bacterium]|nr:phosphotransferase [candidate division KSB1 bacterium]
MIFELQQFLLNEWHDFQFNLPRPNEISVIQRSSTWRKGQGKIVQLLFRRNDRQPFAVAKFARNEAYRQSIVREFEQLRCVRQQAAPEFNQTLPRPLWLGEIGGKTIYLESACQGQSLSRMLSDCRFFLQRKVVQTYELAADWLKAFATELSRHSVTASEPQMERFLDEPLDRILRQNDLSTAEAQLVHRLQRAFIALQRQRVPLVPSHGDFGGGAILLNNQKIAVIDWEFFQPQCLPLFDLFKLLIHPGVAFVKRPTWGMLDQLRTLFEVPWYAELARRLVLNHCSELNLRPEWAGILFPIFLIQLIARHDADRTPSERQGADWRTLFTYYADCWAQRRLEQASWLEFE